MTEQQAKQVEKLISAHIKTMRLFFGQRYQGEMKESDRINIFSYTKAYYLTFLLREDLDSTKDDRIKHLAFLKAILDTDIEVKKTWDKLSMDFLLDVAKIRGNYSKQEPPKNEQERTEKTNKQQAKKAERKAKDKADKQARESSKQKLRDMMSDYSVKRANVEQTTLDEVTNNIANKALTYYFTFTDTNEHYRIIYVTDQMIRVFLQKTFNEGADLFLRDVTIVEGKMYYNDSQFGERPVQYSKAI